MGSAGVGGDVGDLDPSLVLQSLQLLVRGMGPGEGATIGTWCLLIYMERKWVSSLPIASEVSRWCPAGAASPISFLLVIPGRELGSG